MKANFDYYKRPIVYMPLCNKINIKWYLGYYTKLLESLESFSSGNQIPSWHQKNRWEQLNIENWCKLDGSRMFVKIKEKFYMKRLLTIASNTFLLWGKLFPTSVASFWVTKTIILSQTTNLCSATTSEQSGHDLKSSHTSLRSFGSTSNKKYSCFTACQ